MVPSSLRELGKRANRWSGKQRQKERNNMSTTDNTTDEVLATLRNAVHESEALLESTAGAVGEEAGKIRAKIQKAVDSAKAACHRVEAKALEGAKATDKVIRSHPYESIGIAFGVGLLIGVLVTRK
jgi:ElaB/YqjD/DUF883 family membrane-anchored ribosome-binding protein